MEQLSYPLSQTKEKNIGTQSAIVDMVREWKGMGENLLESLGDWVLDVESREQNLNLVQESMQKRLKDLEEREREFELFQERKRRELASKEGELSSMWKDVAKEDVLREEQLDKQLKVVSEHIESLEAAQSEVHGLRLLTCEKLKEIERREGEVDSIREFLEKRLREVDQREKELDSLQDGKLRELVLKEEFLSRQRAEFVKEVNLANEKFTEGEKMGWGLIKSLESALKMLDCMKATLEERFKEIESWENAAQISLTASLNEADLIQESLEKHIEQLKEMEREFTLSQEDKMRKLGSKEQYLSIMWNELHQEIKLLDGKLTGREELGHRLLKCLVGMMAKKVWTIESQELALNDTRETFSAKDSGLIRESINLWWQELEKTEEQFHLYQEKKWREPELEEKKLRLIREEFFQEVKYREEKFDEQGKLMYELLGRLDLAQRKVDNTNKRVNERFKEISLKEIEFKYIKDWTEKKINELKFQAKKIGELEREIKAKEDGAVSKENKLEGNKKELELEEGNLGSPRRDLECKEPLLEECDWRDKDLNSIREVALNKLRQPERYFVENHAEYLAENDQQQECKVRELGSKGEPSGVHFKECELKQPQLIDALDTCLRTESVEFVDSKQVVDVHHLEMVINNTEKDSELMADEVFKVLLRSSHPASLVLDAIQGFYTPHFGKGDVELNMRRIRILLLDQLTKMSPKIKPCVREGAVELASEWKSKMRNVNENPLVVLELLHLMAAYNLSSCFDKDELLRFIKMVAHHKQTPELCRILDLTDNMRGFVQNLINEKQYLLASTYIHECELEKLFPQTAVLDYYVKHVKMLARAKCKGKHYSHDAQVKAIASEIADLYVAIEHIANFGLESEYSPDILMARIKQLESDRESLMNGLSSSSLSADLFKQERGKTCAQAGDANKRKAQQEQDEATKEAAIATKAQLPKNVSEEETLLDWKAQDQQSKTKKRRAIDPPSFHQPLSQQEKETKTLQQTKLKDKVPMTHPSSAPKRRRTYIRHFRHQRSPPKHRRLRC